jgi:hypothetical protein
MKKILTTILIFLVSFSFGQFDAANLVNQVMEVQAMRELNQFRENVIKEVKSLNLSNATPEQIDAVSNSYNKMKTTYNTLISQVKQDVLDFKNLKKMSKSSEEVSKRYYQTLNQTKEIFNNEFIPVCAEISQDRSGLLALIFPLIEKGVRFIIDAIRNNKMKKEIFLDELLNVVNTKFNGALFLPEWNTLVTNSNFKRYNSSTIGTNSNDIVYIENTTNVNGTKKGKLATVVDTNVVIDNTDNTVIDPVNTAGKAKVSIQYPALKELSGNIEFIATDGVGVLSNMDFSLPEKSRNLTVGTKVQFSKNSLVSQKSWGAGTSIQIKIKNTGFLYALSFNDGDVCYPIYPYTQDWLTSFSMGQKDRNLIVGPLMLKDEKGVVTIPSKNIETGEENFIFISGTSKKEQLLLILSKSELDLAQVSDVIQSGTGTFEERVNAALGTNGIGEGILLEKNGSSVNFKIKDENTYLIPLIFEIRRN